MTNDNRQPTTITRVHMDDSYVSFPMDKLETICKLYFVMRGFMPSHISASMMETELATGQWSNERGKTMRFEEIKV